MTPETPARIALVTGASGFIGRRVAARLQERSWRVKTLTRSDWSGLPLVPREDRFFGRLPDDIPAEALSGVRAIVHCAALTTGGSDAATREVNLRGTLELARRAKGSRFVFVSTQSAREDFPTAYGRTKHEAERQLLSMPDLDAVVVRPGLVIGRGGLFEGMRRMVRRLPLLPLPDGGRALVQPVDVDDLAAALVACVEGPIPRGSVLRIGAPTPLPLRELLERTCRRACGRTKPSLPVPLLPAILVASALEALGLRAPVPSASLRALRHVEPMETSADLARLGLELRSLDASLEDACREEA